MAQLFAKGNLHHLDGFYQLKHYQDFPTYVEQFLAGGGLMTARQCHLHAFGGWRSWLELLF